MYIVYHYLFYLTLSTKNLKPKRIIESCTVFICAYKLSHALYYMFKK